MLTFDGSNSSPQNLSKIKFLSPMLFQPYIFYQMPQYKQSPQIKKLARSPNEDQESYQSNCYQTITNSNAIALARKATKRPPLKQILERFNSLSIRRISRKEIGIFQHKFYLELVKHNWFPFPSPTEFEIVEENGINRIIDKYDKMKCTVYYGVFDNERMVAGCRLIIGSKIDLMNYQCHWVKQDGFADFPLENSRNFVDPEFRWNSRILILLLIAVREEFGDVPIVFASVGMDNLKRQETVKLIGFVRYFPQTFYVPIFSLVGLKQLRKIGQIQRVCLFQLNEYKLNVSFFVANLENHFPYSNKDIKKQPFSGSKRCPPSDDFLKKLFLQMSISNFIDGSTEILLLDDFYFGIRILRFILQL